MNPDIAGELAAIRAAAEEWFPQTAVISRLSETADATGGMAQAWTANGTVACRLTAKSGLTRAVAGQTQATGSYTLTVPHDASVIAGDRVTVDAVVYRVAFVDDVRTWRSAIRADVELEVS